MKLSERAKLLLLVVNKATIRDWGTGEIERYYISSADPEYGIEGAPDGVWIHGAGDARAFESLARKGLIERPKTCPAEWKYCYAITEDGRLAVESILHPDAEG